MQMVGQRQHQVNLKANVKPRNLYRRQHDGQHLCKPKQHRPVSMTTMTMMAEDDVDGEYDDYDHEDDDDDGDGDNDNAVMVMS